MTAAGAPRDDGPASSADGADAGLVVFGGQDMRPRPLRTGSQGIMQVTPPTLDHGRVARAAEGLVAMREGLARMGEAVRQVRFDPPLNLPAGTYVIGIDPGARGAVVFATRQDDADQGQDMVFVGDLVRESMRGFREAYANRRADREEAEALGQLTPAQVAEAFGLPPEIVFGPVSDLETNEELIRSTRAEFPDDPYEYGQRYAHGPMRWTPPPEGEDVPPWP